MLRQISLFLYLAVAITPIVWGQTPADHIPTEKALLWEITGKDLSKPSYLFGTIHMIGKSDYVLHKEVSDALGGAQRVTFEINMEKMMDISSLMPLMMKMYMNKDTTLRDLLSIEEYALVKAKFEDLGLPLMFLERIKPMFLSMLLSDDMNPMEGGGLGSDDASIISYEMELMKLAKKQEKPIDGLETAEYQMSIFDSIPYKAQAEMLVKSIKGEDTESMDDLDEMVKMYKAQDIQAMQSMMDDDSEGMGKYEDLLLAGRNRNWIPVMGRMMAKEPTFFAVGAGHLGGAHGVIALLRDAGYTVKAVPFTP